MGGHRAHFYERQWPWMQEDPTPLQLLSGLDWNAVRRGRQVYTEVFAPCHPLHRLTYNHFQAFMTKEEIKKLASQQELIDTEPDKEGNIHPRQGNPRDWLPMPFPNSKAAQFANNGAEPPDLRTAPYAFGHLPNGGIDYIFSLMTGYHWKETLGYPPWAPELKPGQFWNPYFKGGVISMPPPLSDGLIEYEDGTPATVSQMAKDVGVFLKWTNELDYDERRVAMWKSAVSVLAMGVMFTHFCNKRVTWRFYQRINFRWWKNVW